MFNILNIKQLSCVSFQVLQGSRELNMNINGLSAPSHCVFRLFGEMTVFGEEIPAERELDNNSGELFFFQVNGFSK